MKRIFCLLFTLPLGLIAQETLNKTITHDGGTREYIIHIPPTYDGSASVPLVLCFHGYTSSANTIMNYSGFNARSDVNNFIIAYPQGTLLDGYTHWNVGGWTTSSTTDDVGFTDHLLDTIMNDYNIDGSKVYSTGMSNGGYMSFLLACQLSDRFAAVASVTGSMTPQTYNACNPTHPTPILQIHGTDDGTVPYNGSSTWTKSIEDVLAYWSGNNNCNPTRSVTDIEDSNQSDGSTVELIKYSECDDCSYVEHYKITGGDHDWPGVWGNMDIHATDVVWEFLSKYDINGKIDCGNTVAVNENKSSENINLISTETDIRFTGLTSFPTSYHVFNLSGQLLKSGTVSAESTIVSTNELTKGMYLVKLGTQTLRFVKL